MLYYFWKGRVLEFINNILDLPWKGIFYLASAEEFDIQNTEGLYGGIENFDTK